MQATSKGTACRHDHLLGIGTHKCTGDGHLRIIVGGLPSLSPLGSLSPKP